MPSVNNGQINEVFPNWPAANMVLKILIAATLGVYLDVHENKSETHISIHYLPNEVYRFIPHALRLPFYRAYGEFSHWANITLGLEKALAPWAAMGSLSDKDLDKVKEDIAARITRYDEAGLSNFRDVFLRFMGVTD